MPNASSSKPPGDSAARGSGPLTIPADHPAIAGHFPGHPVVPGALLLAHALAAIPDSRGRSIRLAKFPRPAIPGTPLTLRWQEALGEIRFECADGAGAVVMTGILAR